MRVARWILASGLIVAAAPLFAQTVAVGTCQPNKTSFPKIQQALNATPPGAPSMRVPVYTQNRYWFTWQ
jgi:hypothetical protein